MDTLKTIEAILRDIFDDVTLQINESTSANDIEDWDSIAQIRIASEVESAFSVKFSFAELQGMKNVGDMVRLIEKKKQ
jgi:acyl carrier protein